MPTLPPRPGAAGVVGAPTVSDFHHPPRNIRRHAEVVKAWSGKIPAAGTGVDGLMRQEALIVRAALAPATWQRRAMVTAELLETRRVFPELEPWRVVTVWGTLSLRARAPTTVKTLWYTALALLSPSLKREQRLKMWGAGLAALYGSLPWYPRPPAITPEQAMQVILGSEEWMAVRMDVAYSLFARDADLTYLLAVDAQPSLLSAWTFTFPFMKNDQRGQHVFSKTVQLRRPLAFAAYRERRGADEPLFPQTFAQVTRAIRMILGPAYGTGGVRRGAAQAARAAGAEGAEIQGAMAHRNPRQHIVYAGGAPLPEARRQAAVTEKMWGVAGATEGGRMSPTSSPTPRARPTIESTRTQTRVAAPSVAAEVGRALLTSAPKGVERGIAAILRHEQAVRASLPVFPSCGEGTSEEGEEYEEFR